MNEPRLQTTEKQSLRPAEELLYHLQYATREAETILRGGIVEVAVRNRRVAEYCEHWEGRALKAEAKVERLQRIETAAKQLLSLVEAKGQPHDAPENVALLEAGDTIAVNEGNLWALQMEINS